MAYKIIREAGKNIKFNKYIQGDYRILNTDNNILNPNVCKTLDDAKEVVAKLQQWKRGNKSKSGIKRTSKHNKHNLALFKAGKLK